MLQKYIKLSEYAKLKGITYQTAHRHYQKGFIPGAYQDAADSIYVPVTNQNNYNDVATYRLVSSNEMKDNLIRQDERLREYAIRNNYNIIKSVKEICSGMNDCRPKLMSLLTDNTWNTLIIENKDRLTRFGFNYIKTLLETLNKKLIVINESDDDKSSLMEDLISIIYSFSDRMYGLRRQKKKEDIIKFIES